MKELHLRDRFFGSYLGKVGEKSNLTDTKGEVLYVGDVVELEQDGEYLETVFIVHPEDYGCGNFIGVDGLHFLSRDMINGGIDTEYGTIFKVTKTISFEDIVVGGTCNNIEICER